MIGERVEHPTYGVGQILAVYRNGLEWLVLFGNGLRFRRPRSEFVGQDAPVMAPAPLDSAEPMPQTQFDARRLIESLRAGIAPATHVRELTIGIARERASLTEALERTQRQGGDARVVVGEYGFGKTHLLEWTVQEALARGFLVATTSLDLHELPPHRAFAVYGQLMSQLRYPDSDERGLEKLMLASAESEAVVTQLADLSGVQRDPLLGALTAMSDTSSSRVRKAWWRYVQGSPRHKLQNRGLPRDRKFPTIYQVGHNQRQIAYLLGGLSLLARLNHYAGLCVLIDEAECYSLLPPMQRARAAAFFQAVTAAALGEAWSRRAAELPHHRYAAYPLTYGGRERQALFFLFTTTRSDNRMPLEQWMGEEQVFQLEAHYAPQEIGHLLAQIGDYHAQAYAYAVDERHGQVRRAAAEYLSEASRSGQLSPRSLVRMAVELFDLVFLHVEYPIPMLLDELRAQLR